MKHLQFKNINDCFEKVAEIQVRHELKEITDKSAMVQLVACKLYFEMDRYRRKVELQAKSPLAIGNKS